MYFNNKKIKATSHNFSNRAFTLIELLVVIAIIGILAGMIFVSMNSATTSARDIKAKAELSSLSKALLAYGAVNSGFPVSSPSPCNIGDTGASGCIGASGLNILLPAAGYSLIIPSSGYYQYTSNGQSFSLQAQLTNRTYTQDYFNNTSLSCDTGWIDSGHGFCVMQYEAKITGNDNGNQSYNSAFVPESRASGTPWVNITQTNAIAECNSLGNGAHLITNAEWMAIANDVVNQTTNWTTGTVGSGILARGFVNTSNTAPAPNTGSGYEYNTGANTVGASGTIDYRRTLNLANSNIIWDFPGNVWEWTNDTITGANSQATPNGWKEYTAVTNWGAITSNDAIPNNNATLCGGSACTSSNGIGRFYTDTSLSNARAFRRGGGWSNGTGAGVFALYLTNAPATTNTSIGFRCAR